MGKARILGNNCILLMQSASTGLPIPIGEIDAFGAKSNTKIITSRPIGYIIEGATIQYGSWSLTFDSGKVDWSLAHFYWLQDSALLKGNIQPNFNISQTITHYDGTVESYVYEDVTLFGLDFTASIDEIREKIEGFSPKRRIGAIDTTYGSKSTTNIIREAIFKQKEIEDAAKSKIASIANNIADINISFT